MEILGIGPQELIFIVIIALLVLGPKDMQKAGKTIGQWLNRFLRSDLWKGLQDTSKIIRTLPNTLMREANLEELDKIKQDIKEEIKPPSGSKSYLNKKPTDSEQNSPEQLNDQRAQQVSEKEAQTPSEERSDG